MPSRRASAAARGAVRDRLPAIGPTGMRAVKLGIVSDIHGNLAGLQKALDVDGAGR